MRTFVRPVMMKKSIIATVLVFCGFSGSPSFAQLQWRLVAPMLTPRSFTATAVLDGLIYVAGGEDARGNVVDTVERFDPRNNTWEVLPPLKKARAGAAATAFMGRIHVVGGYTFEGGSNEREVLNDVEVFDSDQNRWESFDDMEQNREGLTVLVMNGTMYAIGGADDEGAVLDGVEAYDVSRSEWTEDPLFTDGWRLSVPRVFFASVLRLDAVYVFGGFGNFSGPIGQTESFSISSGTSILNPFPVPRGGLTAETIDTEVYLIGGRRQDNTITAAVDIYNTVTDTWTPSVPLNVGREHMTSAIVDNTLYVFGGRDLNGDVLAETEAFGPISTAIGVEELPVDFRLEQAYPNPFSVRTAIPFMLSAETAYGRVQLVVFDVLGREIVRLVDEYLAPGEHVVEWDGRDGRGVPTGNGIYIFRLTQGRYSVSNQLVLLH